jgi:hypothetical protein
VLGDPLADIRVMSRPVFVVRPGSIVQSLEPLVDRPAQMKVAREHA